MGHQKGAITRNRLWAMALLLFHEVIQGRKLHVADYHLPGNHVHIPLDHFKACVTQYLLQAVDVPAVL